MDLRHQYFSTIDSTNNAIKRQAVSGEPEGLVISAGEQTSGRGRSGHVWKSPLHDSIATSILLRPHVHIENVSRITILAALSVADAIKDEYGLRTQIKWPNDILINKKKVCGILTEMSAKDNAIEYVVVGIGVNVHNKIFPEEIRDIATSIDLELSGKGSRKALTTKIWAAFKTYYETFNETESLAEYVETYNSRLVNLGKEVKVLDPNGEYTGISEGIDDSGALLVKKNNEVRRVDSGEVSVRGIYGYV